MDPCDYHITVKYSKEVECYVGKVKELPDIEEYDSTYDGTYRRIITAIEEASEIFGNYLPQPH